MRIIDYGTSQLLEPFSTESDEKAQQLKRMPTFKEKPVEQILKEIKEENQMNMNIIIKNPLVKVRPIAHDKLDEYVVLNLGKINIVQNKELNKARILKKSDKEIPPNAEVISTFFRFYMEEMGINYFKGNQIKTLSKPFDFNLEIERLSYYDEYSYCFPDVGTAIFLSLLIFFSLLLIFHVFAHMK